MAGVYSVSQITSYVKNMFRQDFVLNKVSVKGEISNCKYHSSGHIYFTIKDENSTLSAIMFSGSRSGLSFELKEGLRVIVTGRIDIYERDGKYQLYAQEIEPDGQGELFRKFELLKQELYEMGLFAPEYKKPIPQYAKSVGIVTADTGAAIRDIINVSKRRNPYVQLVLYPALVQGENAKYEIVEGIKKLDAMNLDVLIVGRGGGSIEDLWAFNEEMVARAIFDCKTPVISAVGHETDFTIADFTADLRAPTPSAAAELAVADFQSVQSQTESYEYKLKNHMMQKLAQYKSRMDIYYLKFKGHDPVNSLNEKRQLSAQYEDRLNDKMKNILEQKRHRLSIYAEKLNGLSPLNKLSQGYAFVQKDNDMPVKSTNDVKEDDLLKVIISDGQITTKVLQVDRSR